MTKFQVSERHLEVLTAGKGAMIPIFAYEKMQEMSPLIFEQQLAKTLRYFGEQKLLKMTKDKIVLAEQLYKLIEASKTNEQFFISEHYLQGNLQNIQCLYAGEDYFGVEKTLTTTNIISYEELEQLVKQLLQGLEPFKQVEQPIEVTLSRDIYIKWMKNIQASNEQGCKDLLIAQGVDEDHAAIIWQIFEDNKNFLTVSLYKNLELQSQVMVMASEYAICLKFSESNESSFVISTLSLEELNSLIHLFLLAPVLEIEDETEGEAE